jgi:hypothetical protein
MDALLRNATQRALRYLDDLDERSVAPLPEDVRRLVELGGALPERPGDDGFGGAALFWLCGWRFITDSLRFNRR